MIDNHRVEIPKAYFGKFQPDLYILFNNQKDKSTQELLNEPHDDILVQFKNHIDEAFKFTTYMVSGKVRFSVRGFFLTDCKINGETGKNWFNPNPNGPHLLTCVWARENEIGIDPTGCLESILFQNKKWSSSMNTSYSYIITMVN